MDWKTFTVSLLCGDLEKFESIRAIVYSIVIYIYSEYIETLAFSIYIFLINSPFMQRVVHLIVGAIVDQIMVS